MIKTLLQKKAVDISDTLEVKLFVKEDIDDIIMMLSNPRMHAYLFFADEGQEDAYRAYFEPLAKEIDQRIQQQEKPQNIPLIIREKASGNFVGMVGAKPAPMIDGVYEIGYQIAVPYWGKSIATLAAKKLIEILEKDYQPHKLQADLYGGNKASKRVLQKLGFTLEGRLASYYLVDGGFDDKVIYGKVM